MSMDKEYGMENVKILEVKQSIFASNDEQAAALRANLKEKKIFFMRKKILLALIGALKRNLKVRTEAQRTAMMGTMIQ